MTEQDQLAEHFKKNSNMMTLKPLGPAPFKPGDEARRIWGDGFLTTYMRVTRIDAEFIYCDSQRGAEDVEWIRLTPGSLEWKFDRVYGVETDEKQGWGIEPYGRNLVLSRIEPL